MKITREVDKDSGKMFVKGLVPIDLKFNSEEKSVVAYISTLSVDRDGEVILPQGADLTDYKKNPIVLWAHDYRSLPIGRSAWVKTDDKGLISKTIYANHEFAQKVFEYRKEGYPLAQSIGFMPKKWVGRDDSEWKSTHAEWEKMHTMVFGKSPDVMPYRIYTEWSMLEYSDVPVPSNPDAIQLAVSKGLLQAESAKDWEYEEESPPVVDRTEELEKALADMIQERDQLQEQVVMLQSEIGDLTSEVEQLTAEVMEKKSLLTSENKTLVASCITKFNDVLVVLEELMSLEAGNQEADSLDSFIASSKAEDIDLDPIQIKEALSEAFTTIPTVDVASVVADAVKEELLRRKGKMFAE